MEGLILILILPDFKIGPEVNFVAKLYMNKKIDHRYQQTDTNKYLKLKSAVRFSYVF